MRVGRKTYRLLQTLGPEQRRELLGSIRAARQPKEHGPSASSVGITVDEALAIDPLWINLGGKRHCHPRRQGWVSLDMTCGIRGWAVWCDLRNGIPLPANSVDRMLTEHFLEHLRKIRVEQLLAESHRVLKPGSLFRIAVPDYGHPVHVADLAAGYDLGCRAHKCLFTLEILEAMLQRSPFERWQFLHYWKAGKFVSQPIDYSLAPVRRTPENDPRNSEDREPYGRLTVTSLVVDVWK